MAKGFIIFLKKIKVLRIIARLNIGGPAVHSILLTMHLNNDRFDSLLLTGMIGKGEGDMTYLADANNIKPILIKELGREISWRDDITAFLKILRLIFKEKPDIIHTHTAKAGTLGRMAGIIYNLISPYKAYLVHTFHGHIFNSYFSALKTNLFVLIERILARFTDKIIIISKGQANEISERLKIKDKGKLELIPLGLNLSPFYESEKYCGLFKRELGLDDDTSLIGIIGRLVPVKNHRMFLDSVKKYKTNHAAGGFKVKFLIIGDGELREGLKKYSIDSGIKDDVIFTGWRKDLERVYSDIDIVVITSLNEGTPVSIIEAMASGKPVISTDVGGVRDMFTPKFQIPNSKFKIQNEGMLVNSNDSDSLAEGIKFLINNPKISENMGKNGRASVKERFDIKRLVGDVEKMYESLINWEGGWQKF